MHLFFPLSRSIEFYPKFNFPEGYFRVFIPLCYKKIKSIKLWGKTGDFHVYLVGMVK